MGEIRKPIEYIAAMKGVGPSVSGRKMMQQMVPIPMSMVKSMAMPSMGAALFKKDGTPIRKPEAFVKKIEENGYTEPIFDAMGKKIHNPVKYLESKGDGGSTTPSLFKADGTPIRKPKEY